MPIAAGSVPAHRAGADGGARYARSPPLRTGVGTDEPETGARPVFDAAATRRSPWSASASCRSMLGAGLTAGVDYYSEFIDQARFAARRVPDGVPRLPAHRSIKQQRFDLVIAMGDVPLEFVEKYTARAVRGRAGRVLFGRPACLARLAELHRHCRADLDLAGTGRLARALQPDLRRYMSFVGARRRDRDVRDAGARAVPVRSSPRLAVTYLSGLPTPDLEARRRSLPAHSIVYYLIVDRDGAGRTSIRCEYLDRSHGRRRTRRSIAGSTPPSGTASSAAA